MLAITYLSQLNSDDYKKNQRAEPIPGKALAKSRKVYFFIFLFKTLGLGGGDKNVDYLGGRVSPYYFSKLSKILKKKLIFFILHKKLVEGCPKSQNKGGGNGIKSNIFFHSFAQFSTVLLVISDSDWKGTKLYLIFCYPTTK